MITRHVTIIGRVQGVGYRDWMVRAANRLGVSGWVRNSGDATVEAVVQGEPDSIEALLAACRRGPPHAHVEDIRTEQAAPIEADGFLRVASV
jgi:acylphosphatase